MELADRISALTAGTGRAALMNYAKELEKQGEDIIWLTTGEPDFCTPELIQKATIDALSQGYTHYVPAAGISQLRAAIAAEETQLQGQAVQAEQVVVTPGSYQALFCTLMALVNPGDEVLLTDPGFGPYANVVKLAGGIPVYFPTWNMEESKFTFDVDIMQKKVTGKAKVLIVNNPWNPTGRVLQEVELKAIADFAVKNGLTVILDQVYRSLVFAGYEYISLARFLPEHAVVVDSFSKAYAMTGWRLGYVTAPKKVAAAISRINHSTARCATAFIQYGALAAYQNPDQAQEALTGMLAEYQERRDYLVRELKSIPQMEFHPPEGGFYLYCNVSKTGSNGEDFCWRLLKELKIAASPGSFFGPSGADYIRISFSIGLQRLKDTMKRLQTIL
jgi:aspartate aminotransferase